MVLINTLGASIIRKIAQNMDLGSVYHKKGRSKYEALFKLLFEIILNSQVLLFVSTNYFLFEDNRLGCCTMVQ